MMPPIPARLGVDLAGGAPEVRLAGQILVAIELEAMRQAMGYHGEGSWQQHRGEDGKSTRPDWLTFCRTAAGISDVTAAKHLRMAIAVQRRLEKRPGLERFAAMMEKPPSTLTAEDLEELRGVIAREVKGTTRKTLVAEVARPRPDGMSFAAIRSLMRRMLLQEARRKRLAEKADNL